MKRFFEQTVPIFSWLCGILLLGAIFTVIGYLLVHGWKSIGLTLIFGKTQVLDALLMKRQVLHGLFPAIVGTLALVVIAVCLAVPVGMASGIYLAEYAGNKSKAIFNLIFDIMAGLPSIVIGLFGFSAAVFLNRHFSGNIHPCLLISSIALAFLVLPYIIRTTQMALEGLPHSLRITGLSLGASKLQNIAYVLLPQSLSGVISGVILAIGRCAEDTAVIMLTGVVASTGVPRSLLSHYEALPFYIYYISSQYTDSEELATGYGAAILLLCICLMFFLPAFIIRKRVSSLALLRA